MLRWPMVLAAALASLVALTLSHSPLPDVASAQPGQALTTIPVGDNYFCAPAFEGSACTTVVSAGDTVVWSYAAGNSVHTSTGAGWDTGALSPGGTFSFTFGTPGSFPYQCDLHPAAMRGIIEVAAPPVAVRAVSQVEPAPAPAQPAIETAPPPAPGDVDNQATAPAAAPAEAADQASAPAPASGPGENLPNGGGLPAGAGSLGWWPFVVALVLLGGGAVAVGRSYRR